MTLTKVDNLSIRVRKNTLLIIATNLLNDESINAVYIALPNGFALGMDTSLSAGGETFSA